MQDDVSLSPLILRSDITPNVTLAHQPRNSRSDCNVTPRLERHPGRIRASPSGPPRWDSDDRRQIATVWLSREGDVQVGRLE